MKNILKSIGCMLAGFATGAIPSIGTDLVLEKVGFMKTQPFNDNPAWLIILVIAYRNVYNLAGSYVTAKLAPNYPMRHVMIMGVLGLLVGIAGTIVMWDVPPHWYPITLVVLTLPVAWLGGKLATHSHQAMTNDQ